METLAYTYLWLAWEQEISTQHLQVPLTSVTDIRCRNALKLLEESGVHQYIDDPVFQEIKNLLTPSEIQTQNYYRLALAMAEFAISHTPDSSLFKVVSFKTGKKPENFLDLATFLETFNQIETCEIPLVPILTKALQNQNADIRNYAALILAKINQPTEKTVPVICECLVTGEFCQNPGLRQDMIQSLGNIPDSQASSLLKQVAQNKNESLLLRQSAINELKNYQDPQIYAFLQRLSLDKNQDVSLRQTAINILVNLKTDQVKSLIKQIAEDKNEVPELRQIALNHFGNIADSQTLTFLKQTFKNPNENSKLRQAGIQAISQIKNSQALDFIQSIVQNTNEAQEFRLTAIQTLDPFQDRQTLNLLQQVIQDKNESLKLRRVAIQTLENIKNYQARVILQKVVENQNYEQELRQVALSVLGHVPLSQLEENQGFLVFEGQDAFSSEEPQSANFVFQKIEDLSTINLLIKTAKNLNESLEIRQIAIKALGKVDETQSVNCLIKIAQNLNESQALRHTALKSLGEIKTPQAFHFLRDFLNNLNLKENSRENFLFFLSLAQSLAEASPKDGLPILINFWKEDIQNFINLSSRDLPDENFDLSHTGFRICSYQSYIKIVFKIGKPAQPFLENATQTNDPEIFKQFIQLTLKGIEQDLSDYYHDLCKKNTRASALWVFQRIGRYLRW